MQFLSAHCVLCIFLETEGEKNQAKCLLPSLLYSGARDTQKNKCNKLVMMLINAVEEITGPL